MGVIHTFLIFQAIIFMYGQTRQTKMVMSPTGNVTTIMAESFKQFVCIITPCVGVGSMALSFGNKQMLFSGPCKESVNSSELQFFCQSYNCTYGVHVFNLTANDDGKMVNCSYLPPAGNSSVIFDSRLVRVLQKPKTKPRLEPVGPFQLMEEVTVTCISDGGNPTPSLSFSCGSNEGHVIISQNGTLSSSLQLTMDSRMENVKCRCIISQEGTGYYEETSFHVIYLENITTISPRGSLTDGQNTTFVCCIGGEKLSNISILFNCHGNSDRKQFEDYGCLDLLATVDIDKNGTDCICSATSEDGSVDVSSDIKLKVLPYKPNVQLSSSNEVAFGEDVELTCSVKDLEYPFAFGEWIIPGPINRDINCNSTYTETTLTVIGSTYDDIGEYNCTIVDERKGSVVSVASSKLSVKGPVFMKKVTVNSVNSVNGTHCILTMFFESDPKPILKTLWKENEKIRTFQIMKEKRKEGITYEMQYYFGEKCFSEETYGVVVTNDEIKTEAAFYFNYEGQIFNEFPMLKATEMITDGKPASVTCLDITESSTRNIKLVCENITESSTKIEVAMVKLNFVADIDNNGTNCSCYSKKGNKSSNIVIPVKPYITHMLPIRYYACESNSKITLKCTDEQLPESFVFGKWIHLFDGFFIRELHGIDTKESSILEIQFCTFEDIGNYTCTITDKRKNKTIHRSAVYLSVPGPPVIVNTTVIPGQQCTFEVNFYSFNIPSVKVMWFKDGRRLYPTEHQKQTLKTFSHHLLMHNTNVEMHAKTARLQITKECDIDHSKYRVNIENMDGRISYTFEKESNTVHIILIVFLTAASVVFLAGIMIIICKNAKGLVSCHGSCQKGVYNAVNVRFTRSSQFYEEIDMVIESLRQADEEECSRKHDRDSKYSS